MSIFGTCPECLHHTDGMCDLRPRICLNYDHFERRPMVTLTRDDFEKLYISRAAYDELNAKVAALQAALDAAINMNIEKNAEVVRLTAALKAADEDAAALAHDLDSCTEGLPWQFNSQTNHRARVNGKLEGGESVMDSPDKEAKG